MNCLWFKKNRFYFASVLGCLTIFLSGLYSLFSNEYESSCVIMSQRKESRIKTDITSLINTFSEYDTDMEYQPLSSKLYDKLLGNDFILRDLMYSEFVFSDSETPISLYEYILKKRHFSIILFPVKEEDVHNKVDKTILDGCYFTQEELFCLKYIKKHLLVSYLPKNGVSVISFRMSDQKAVTEITMRIVELLKVYLEQMRVYYSEEYYQLAEDRIKRSYDEFNDASLSLALYEDSHHGKITRLSDVDRSRLSAQYSFAEDQLIQSSKYYINAYVNMMEDLPPFIIISQPSIPNRKHRIDLLSLLFLSIIGGLTIGSLFIHSNKGETNV